MRWGLRQQFCLTGNDRPSAQWSEVRGIAPCSNEIILYCIGTRFVPIDTLKPSALMRQKQIFVHRNSGIIYALHRYQICTHFKYDTFSCSAATSS